MIVESDDEIYDEDDEDFYEEEDFMGMMIEGAGELYGAADFYQQATWDLVVKNSAPNLPQLDMLLQKFQNQIKNRKFFTHQNDF